MNRVWLITGANSGFGRAVTVAAVAAGDIAVATARRVTSLDDLAAAHPAKAAAAILTALDAPDTPLRLPLGDDAVDAILSHLDSTRADIHTWEKLARDTRLVSSASLNSTE